MSSQPNPTTPEFTTSAERSAEHPPAFRTIPFPDPSQDNHAERLNSNSLASVTEIRLLTPQEVAKRLGVSDRWVRDHATRRFPRIRAVKLGPLLRFRLADIEDFLIENSTSVSSKKRGAGV